VQHQKREIEDTGKNRGRVALIFCPWHPKNNLRIYYGAPQASAAGIQDCENVGAGPHV
jgi:hypothetical protein